MSQAADVCRARPSQGVVQLAPAASPLVLFWPRACLSRRAEANQGCPAWSRGTTAHDQCTSRPQRAPMCTGKGPPALLPRRSRQSGAAHPGGRGAGPPPGAPCTRRASATHRSPPSWRRSGCAWPSPRPAPWRAPRRTARAPALCTSRLARACLLLAFSLLACRAHCSSARRAATAEPTFRALHRAGSCRGGAPRRQQQRARRAAPPPQVRACWEVRTRLQQGGRCGCTPSACRDPQRTSISRVCVCVCVSHVLRLAVRADLLPVPSCDGGARAASLPPCI